ncbi:MULTISPECIES: TetR/AcrR family transcriptional regulator [Pseudofrankia]|uniref:TetR/AcrR family transcriptional regulator n=1 Tax=Pseudofrankia TaxID=2994363 RepID=UPI00047FEE62|nr:MULTISPECIES: TetR/AcrR family transcriptional regulator [Pseudofrankia]OHV35358.1 TetR family transcriptional regulator [Pseudofrankia sp. EUN1h]
MPRTIDRDARKAQLAAAVWRIIVERGIGAVSVRSVAEEAGVVVGSLRHVFPTRAELLEFSARLMVDRATARILATPRSDDPVEFAYAILRHLLPLEPDSRAEFEVNLALIAESPALPSLVEIRDYTTREVGELCHQVVELLTGRPRDETTLTAARRLHALVDGLGLHLLTQPPDADPTWATALVRAELTRLLAASS